MIKWIPVSSLPEEESEVLEKVSTENHSSIIIYNDDINTFDWVIECLVELCKHTEVQAEQCAWIIHTKGKHAVKWGEYNDLAPTCQALCDRGLSAKIEI